MGTFLFADNKELSVQSYAKLWTFIDQQLVTAQINQFYLEVQNSNNQSLYYQLTHSAKKNNYIVFENIADSVAKLLIYIDQKRIETESNHFLLTRITTKEYPSIRIMLVKDNQVLFSEEISFENNALENKNTKAKWFDPIILTAVVGSLIYLIYYGNH